MVQTPGGQAPCDCPHSHDPAELVGPASVTHCCTKNDIKPSWLKTVPAAHHLTISLGAAQPAVLARLLPGGKEASPAGPAWGCRVCFPRGPLAAGGRASASPRRPVHGKLGCPRHGVWLPLQSELRQSEAEEGTPCHDLPCGSRRPALTGAARDWGGCDSQEGTTEAACGPCGPAALRL